jgi:putative ABC transport system permease protein
MLRNYYTIAFRFLAKSKIYTTIHVVGLVVGFTSFILISLYVTDELTYDNFTNSDRLFRIVNTAPENNPWLKGMPQTPVQMAADIPEIESFARLLFTSGLMKAEGKTMEESNVVFADPSFFKLFSFEQRKDSYSFPNENSVLITSSTAKRYFGENNPVGKLFQFTLADDTTAISYEVSGVMDDLPSNVHFHFDFLLPYAEGMDFQGNVGVYTYLLLKPEASANAVESKFTKLNNIHFEAWGNDQSQRIQLQPISAIHLDSKYAEEIEEGGNRQVLYILGLAAVLILVVGLINFINISLARSIKRAKEVGIRKILGAQRRQVAAQFLMESMSLLTVAAIIALAISQVLLPFFNVFTSKNIAPEFYEYLPILAIIILFSGILASAYPALLLSGALPAVVLKDTSSVSFLKGTKLRSVLLMAQFSIAMVLMIATFTIWRQLEFIQSKELGFDKDHVVVVHIDNPETQRHYANITQLMEKIPGVKQVAASGAVPGEEFAGWPYQLPASSSLTGEAISLGTTTLFVDEDYLSMMGMKTIMGRAFSTDNFESDTQNSLLVNESFLSEFGWDQESAIGKTIQYFNPNIRAFSEARVIGVIRDFHFQSFHSKIEPLIIRLRNPNSNFGFISAMNSISIKIEGEKTSEVIEHLKEEWKEIDASYPFDFEFLDDAIQRHYEKDQRFGQLLLGFALISILITCLGLLGISMLTIEQRTKEIGIRKILGASAPSIVQLLTTYFVRLLAISTLLSIPIGYWIMEKWLSNFSYRVDVTVLWIIVAGFLVAAISMSVVGIQSWRASSMNPVDSLRSE